MAKLSDFGLSNILESGHTLENPTVKELQNAIKNMMTTVGGRGTKAFLAPEFFAAKDGRGLVNGKFRVDPAVDIFALGLVYLYIFCYNYSYHGT